MRDGFSAEEALLSYDLVTAFVFRSAQTDERRKARSALVSPELRRAIEQLAPADSAHLRRMVDELGTLDPQQAFRRNLDCILAGIAAEYGH